MKKNLTEIVCILDRSGSMSGLEMDTIGGYNSMLKKQKNQEGEAYISTVLFSDYSKVIHNREKIDQVSPMTEKEYYVGGCTALLDAIGDAINHIAKVHKYSREEDRPDKTLFIITTDGYENSSRRYSYKKIKQLIEYEKEKYGWEFMFLGANIDAIAESQKFGIRPEMAVNFNCDSQGISTNYNVLSEVVSQVRKERNRKINIRKDWKKDIEEDYNRRHR